MNSVKNLFLIFLIGVLTSSCSDNMIDFYVKNDLGEKVSVEISMPKDTMKFDLVSGGEIVKQVSFDEEGSYIVKATLESGGSLKSDSVYITKGVAVIDRVEVGENGIHIDREIK